jgi:ribosomal protein S18 acetylase RimI-like enzyme
VDAGTTSPLRFRRPVEADHRRIVALVDDWWGGRHLAQLLPRLWFQHFTGTSWIAESADGQPAGFLVGFISPDDPSVGYVHMIATSPSRRRRGLGRELYQRFCDDVAARGVREVWAITWAGNRVSINFHTAIGFGIDDGPGTQRLFGTTAYPNYEGDDQDMVVFRRRVGE